MSDDLERIGSHGLTIAAALVDLAGAGGFASTILGVGRALEGLSAAGRAETVLEEEWREWVTESLKRLSTHVEAWNDRPKEERPTGTDVAAVVEAARRIYERTGDRKKRELLRTAIVNAFDPELYREGLHIRLIRILDDLEYGDLEILGRIAPNSPVEARSLCGAPFTDSLTVHHLVVLRQHGLLQMAASDNSRDWGTGAWPVRITDLGRRMVRLVGVDKERGSTVGA